jgi:signal transduction histidine kinase/CheY-like chemotaxis protein
LHTADFSRWMDRALKLLMVSGLVLIGLTLSIGYALPLHLAPYLALLFTVLCFSAGVMAWWRGLRQARYFLLAWSAFLLGALVYTLMSMGVLPSMFITLHASQIGAAMEVALLSLALADRINVMKEEREQILQDASAKLSALNDQLATSNRLKDEFLATITHELRTPMNGVIGALELMNTVPLESEQAQYQSIAALSARDMLQMVNDILMLTELQAGKLQAECAPFSLQELLASLRQRFAARAAEKGLDFILALDPHLPVSVQGDAGKLGQCLGYLLDNAIKFTASGHVSLHLDVGASSAQQVQLQFRVSDSGVGFQTAGDDQLYQHFQQLDGSLTREYGGLGIGLAICRQLLALLGGRLSHTSTLGRGSEFHLDLSLGLPGQPTPVLAAPVRPRGEPYRQPGECSVLLVEDNSSHTLVLRGMLLKLGYQVRCVDSGAAALEAVRQAPVDAVLMDCQMPPMDGFAVCRALRQLPGLATLPILAITATNHSSERERCLAAGMSDCLSKPVKFDSLQAMLHDWLLCKRAD